MDFNEVETNRKGCCILSMPIKATPYQHQINAFNFVCVMFGIVDNDVFDNEYVLRQGR